MLEICVELMNYGQRKINELKNDQRGEGMVGMIVGILIVVALGVTMWGLISGWLPNFWNGIVNRMNSIA